MTSKNSLPKGVFDFNLIKDTIRKNAWLITLAFVISFFAMPVATALQLQNFSPADLVSPWYIERLTEILIFAFSIKNPLLIAMFSGAAIISGCVVFSYLHSKKQIDFFHSLPIKRERLFITNYIAGLSLIILPYLANSLLTLIVIAAFGKLGAFPAMTALWGAAQHLLFFISVYSVVVLTASLTGNGVINVLLSPVLLGIGPALVGIYMLIMQIFYQSYYSALFPYDKWLAYTSPIARYIASAGNIPLGLRGALALIAFIIAVTLLALYLYLRRPSEAAGSALAFKISRPIIKYPLVFIGTSIMGLAFYSASANNGKHLWLLFGFLCGAFISNGIIEIIYHFDFKALKRNYRGPIIFFILFLILFAVPVFDLTNFDSYIPEEDNVASVSLYMSGVDSYGTGLIYAPYRLQSSRERNLALLKSGLLTQPENIKAALGIINSAIDFSKIRMEDNQPYEGDYSRGTDINVLYSLKNGKKIARSYYMPIKLMAEDLSLILDSSEYRLAHFGILNMEEEELNALIIKEIRSLGDVFSFNGETLSPGVKSALLEAYKKDFISLNSRILKENHAIGIISFEKPYFDERGYSSTFSLEYPVFPSFKNTLAELEGLGIKESDLVGEPGNISKIEIYLDTHKYGSDFEIESIFPDLPAGTISSDFKDRSSLVITDQDDIAKIISQSWPAEAFTYTPFYSSDYSREINVYYTTDTQSYNQFRYYTIKNY